jgi:hypothetical protein
VWFGSVGGGKRPGLSAKAATDADFAFWPESV